MLSPALIRDEVVQVREPRQKRLLTAAWMVQPFHGEQLPLDGIMGLSRGQGAAPRGPPGVPRRRRLRVWVAAAVGAR